MQVKVNGATRTYDGDPEMPLLWVLRDILGLTADRIILLFGVVTLVASIYVLSVVPEFLVRFCLWLLTHTLYRIGIEGQQHVPSRGPALLVCLVGLVVALVRRADQWRDRGEEGDPLEHPGADRRVLVHATALLVGERAGLAQDLGGDADLADVVEKGAVAEPVELGALDLSTEPTHPALQVITNTAPLMASVNRPRTSLQFRRMVIRDQGFRFLESAGHGGDEPLENCRHPSRSRLADIGGDSPQSLETQAGAIGIARAHGGGVLVREALRHGRVVDRRGGREERRRAFQLASELRDDAHVLLPHAHLHGRGAAICRHRPPCRA